MSALSLTMGIIKQKGILGLYKGTSATMLRDVSFSVCYFPLFANLNALGPKTHPGSSKTVFWWSFISGCAAGSISALFVNPADVVKTRLQLINKDAGAQSYNGILDAFTKILKQEGITAFFRGGLCRMIVIAPLVIIFNLLLTKDVSCLEVSFFVISAIEKVDPNFKMRLFYWSTFKFGLLFCLLTGRIKRLLSKKLVYFFLCHLMMCSL